MTVSELVEQAKALSPQERKELIKQLVAIPIEDTVSEVESDWTEEELEELLTVEPMTGAEIVAAGLTGGWADLDIPDGATWVEEQRRKRRKRRQW